LRANAYLPSFAPPYPLAFDFLFFSSSTEFLWLDLLASRSGKGEGLGPGAASPSEYLRVSDLGLSPGLQLWSPQGLLLLSDPNAGPFVVAAWSSAATTMAAAPSIIDLWKTINASYQALFFLSSLPAIGGSLPGVEGGRAILLLFDGGRLVVMVFDKVVAGDCTANPNPVSCARSMRTPRTAVVSFRIFWPVRSVFCIVVFS
jgi:hypothetical protein